MIKSGEDPLPLFIYLFSILRGKTIKHESFAIRNDYLFEFLPVAYMHELVGEVLCSYPVF